MSFDRVQFRSADPEQPDANAMPTRPVVPVTKPEKMGPTMEPGRVSPKVMIGVLAAVLVLGTITGLATAKFLPSNGDESVRQSAGSQTADSKTVESAVKPGAVFGVPDTKTFKDQTEGVLVRGGLNGEGSHTLLREGGVSQNVYLTSSVVDLTQFENARVKIWGETFKGQKAGWLMDVGRLEIVELNAETPDWYQKTQAKNEQEAGE